MSIYSQDYLICPWCKEQSACRVDHLYSEPGRSFGDWYCKNCRMPFEGTVHAAGKVTVKKSNTNNRFTRSLALLRFDGIDGPVFFIMNHDRYYNGEDDSDETNQNNQRYYFDEGSCPINWLRKCIAVIKGDNYDPHGFLRFVRAIDIPEDFNEDQDHDWHEFFPEIIAK